jgi:membrane-bound lytic murein transglycosylase B
MRILARLLAFVTFAALALPATARVAGGNGNYAHRADVRAFARETAAETGLSAAAIERVLAAARYQPKIIELMNRPLLAPPKWFEYAPQFLNSERVAAGAAFWDANASTLARAEAQFGVPAEIIVAIIGVETYWGRSVGGYRALDALATLAFDYPRRAPFFRRELQQLLLLAREQGRAPASLQGSFAGAMGLPQFMPGSYRNYAVDFDGDGRIDLWNSAADAIGSVANFLARHDWARDQPVLLTARVDDGARDALMRRLDGGISERRALDAWRKEGVAVEALPAGLAGDPVGILLLEDSADAASLYLACNNFYVITRYNKSRLYAAAVWRLADAIKASRQQRDARYTAAMPPSTADDNNAHPAFQ